MSLEKGFAENNLESLNQILFFSCDPFEYKITENSSTLLKQDRIIESSLSLHTELISNSISF
uniref:Uncharacterized protein n=1 Tax=Lepeophtheirus salmonis TaxID=72036 RepID=A0A0K2URR7_LEPSM